ncbi:(deoxy)nucleoside triphosphate pyrophosphohydrolase [Maribellus sediminis]|uniref:(deoxy)nucleoside triphosphate pyrophosphohydrolase n=1 Tax=Maribellus sediminis TaxID=2696285 RepID=UPI0014301613|nr:(deoxy)nucleoside triphosphate pyrophosphohydrolase [Maribellus sediminis]
MIEVSCALIVEQGRILIAQNRATSDHPGKWEFPGGKLKKGETPEQSIVREIFEELNLQVKVIRKLEVVAYDYGHKHIQLIPFICCVEGGELALNDHEAVKWISMEQSLNADFSEADKVLLQQPANWRILKEYLRE